MNLYQTIQAIEATASRQPNIRTIVRNDVFRLNAQPGVRYGVFAWLQNEHTTDADSQLITWNFTLFYVDRLTEDKGNEIQIQSVGMEVLDNILKTLPDFGLFPSIYSFRTFNQRFADECAGVFCNVQLEASKGTPCATLWEIDNNVKII